MKELNNVACSPAGLNGEARRYHFELSRYEENNWIPVRIDPLPPDGSAIAEIISNSIVKRILAQPVALKRQYSTLEKVKNGLQVLCLDVRYVMVSANHLFGTIWVLDPPEGSASSSKHSMVITRVDCRYEEKSEEMNYGELLDYMQRYPEVKEHIFEYFFLKLKPKMDKRLEREFFRS